MTARLLAAPYSSSQMTYDLRRLRLNGLIRRVAHAHTYVVTTEGPRVAISCGKLYNRLLRPLPTSLKPTPMSQALAVIDHHVEDYVARALLRHAA